MFEKVKAIIVEQLDIDPERITVDTSLADDIGADSLDVVDLLVTLEDELGITIPQEDVKDVTTVGELCEVIENLR
ncbi:MAG: acyl carrier protein [Oscillospiraceae bacterium]|nr:acyl carrier protein [Oscillospiraceae bacterium]MBR0063707.1 acyl carrier protein [Oscillospiraceae bacterium]